MKCLFPLLKFPLIIIVLLRISLLSSEAQVSVRMSTPKKLDSLGLQNIHFQIPIKRLSKLDLKAFKKEDKKKM